MLRRFRIPAILAVALLVSQRAMLAQTVHPWEVFEVTLEASAEYANPYVEGLPDGGAPLVQAVFTGASGASRGMRYSVAGFWDGGKTWKVRFAPPAAGEWTWSTTSKDLGLNSAKGKLQAAEWSEADKQANPARRGFVRVAKTGEWVGDTWWNWSKRGIKLDSFQRLADDRAEKGFTVGQIFFAGNDGLLNRTYDLPNVEQIRNVEQFIAYANSRESPSGFIPGGAGSASTRGSRKTRCAAGGAMSFIAWEPITSSGCWLASTT